MKVIGYARVSTANQANEDKFGFDSQVAEIERYCKENNYELVGIIKEQISGAKDDRPLFNKILYGEDDLEYEGVVVAKIDRLSRKLEDYFGFKFLLRKRNVELFSANENEEFEKMGIFAHVYEALISTFAELERQRINERMSSGRNIKANKGGYSGGKAPYGYEIIDGKLTINEEEKAIVELVYALREDGLSMTKIADELASENVLTRKGKPIWSTSTIKSILDNKRFYQGYYQYGNCNEVIGDYVPIL